MTVFALSVNLAWWLSCLGWGNKQARVLGLIGSVITGIGIFAHVKP